MCRLEIARQHVRHSSALWCFARDSPGFAPAPAPAAAALSHGFGGDGEAMFTYALVQNMCLARPRGLMCDVGGEVWGFQHRALFAVPTT